MAGGRRQREGFSGFQANEGGIQECLAANQKERVVIIDNQPCRTGSGLRVRKNSTSIPDENKERRIINPTNQDTSLDESCRNRALTNYKGGTVLNYS